LRGTWGSRGHEKRYDQTCAYVSHFDIPSKLKADIPETKSRSISSFLGNMLANFYRLD
jgi:hypothetical protein